MAACAILLEQRVRPTPLQKDVDPVVPQQIDVALRVEPLRTFQQLRLLSSDYATQTIIDGGNFSETTYSWCPFFTHHITGESGEVENRDSSVNMT